MGAGRRALLMRGLQGRPDLVVEKVAAALVSDDRVPVRWATKTTTASTSPAAVDAFIDALKSPELTAILAETGLKRPPGF